MIPYVLTASEEGEKQARGIPDVSSIEVARVYSEAFLNAAEKAGQVDEVLGELEALFQTTDAPRSELRPFFASGVIGRRTRGEVIRKSFEGRANPLLVNLLLVLNDHDRLTLLPVILFETKELRNRRARRLPVTLTSAVPLTGEQVERVRQAVRTQLQLEPLIETKIDPDLLGGIAFRVGDWVFDGTVRTRLNDLREHLIERGSHDIQSGRNRFGPAAGN
jgi:F-type H+-transporting ATPase subunit delta